MTGIDCQGYEVPITRAKTLFPFIVVLPWLVVLSGCVHGRALFLFEQPFLSSLGDETRVRAALIAGAASRGYLPRMAVAPAEGKPVDWLLRESGSLGRGAVVVGPLLSYEWRSFLSRLPASRFILIGSIGIADLPPNALVLSFDRAPEFRSAGRSAAQSAFAAAGRTGMLVSAASDLSDAETAAFIAGVGEVPGAEAPVLQTLPAAPEKAGIQRAIEQMRKEGVEVFLLGLASQDPWGLEVLKATGGRAVVAGWRGSRVYPEQVLLSVEAEVPAGVRIALAAAARGEKHVNGPVSLVKGLAGAGKAAAAGK